MAWNDPFETFVGATGQAYTAPVGTAFPSLFAAPGAAWTGLGYASDDGVAVNSATEREEFRSWQSPHPIRRVRTGETFTLGLALQQWNENNVPLAFGGGEINPISGGYEYVPPNSDDELDEKAVVCDVLDGDRTIRFLIARATASEAVESQFKRGALAVLPVTFAALEPDDGGQLWGFRTNDDSFAAGS